MKGTEHEKGRTRAMREGPKVDEEEATLQLVRMVVAYARGRRVMQPVTIRAKKLVRELLGIKAMETGRTRQCYWLIPNELGIHLERCGIDVETGICVDREKFKRACKEHELEERARVEAKYVEQDYEARREALRESLQAWRPTKAPRVASVGHYLENQVLNERIARELRKAQSG